MSVRGASLGWNNLKKCAGSGKSSILLVLEASLTFYINKKKLNNDDDQVEETTFCKKYSIYLTVRQLY